MSTPLGSRQRPPRAGCAHPIGRRARRACSTGTRYARSSAASYPTIWLWMTRGKFPRSRIVGGKSKWLSSEVETWLAALPLRKLKGDAE